MSDTYMPVLVSDIASHLNVVLPEYITRVRNTELMVGPQD